MAQLSLVKSLSRLQEERQCSQNYVEIAGISLLRGSLTEIVGAASSGRTAMIFALIAELTFAGEVCAVIDLNNSFDPESAVLSGVLTENLLWIKCGGSIEKAFMSADYLVSAKGFGAIWLNLNYVALSKVKYIPSSYWYRFRTGIKESQTLLLVSSRESVLGSAASQSYLLEKNNAVWSGEGKFKLLREINSKMTQKKPLSFRPQTARAGFIYKDV